MIVSVLSDHLIVFFYDRSFWPRARIVLKIYPRSLAIQSSGCSYRVSTKRGTESSNLYLGYQFLHKFETGINVKLIISSLCGIQDAAEI